jgi:hypothetical protein
MNSLVTLADYGDGVFPGIATADEVRELTKALVAGQDINSPGAGAGRGFPLRVESLDDVLKVVTFQQKDLKFWADIPKKPAYNTVEESNRLSSVGNEDGIFLSEGELPEEDDTTYERLYNIIKFMGTLRRVTHPMMVIKNALPDSVLASEARAGTLKLLRGVELKLWDGDATADAVEFSGFFRKFVDGVCGYATGAGNVAGSIAWHADLDTVLATNLMQDLRYGPITEDRAADIITYASDDPNHADITDCYLPYTCLTDFGKQLYPKERTNRLSETGKVGIVPTSFQSPFGEVPFKPSKFVRRSWLANQLGTGNLAKRPAAPTLGVGGVLTPALAGGFPGFGGTTQGRTAPVAVDGAGNYTWQVVACNRYGKSAPLSIAPVAVAAGDMAQIPLVDGSPAGVTTHYEIYRSLRGGAATTARFIFRATRTAAAQTVTDFNRFLPGTSKVYWIQRNLQAMAWQQLLPLLKINLAQIDLTVRFAMILYGALEVYAPRKHAVMINVGPLT